LESKSAVFIKFLPDRVLNVGIRTIKIGFYDVAKSTTLESNKSLVQYALWSIIGDSGFVVSAVVSSALASFSFHLLTGKMGTRP
jgi:hypothetical protein